MSIFKSDKILRDLRHDANRLDEWAANRFMLRYLTHYIFFENEWIVSTEVPPTEHHSQLRMDMAVQNYDDGQRLFMFKLIGQERKDGQHHQTYPKPKRKHINFAKPICFNTTYHQFGL